MFARQLVLALFTHDLLRISGFRKRGGLLTAMAESSGCIVETGAVAYKFNC